jgi:hypothetical protein
VYRTGTQLKCDSIYDRCRFQGVESRFLVLVFDEVTVLGMRHLEGGVEGSSGSFAEYLRGIL